MSSVSTRETSSLAPSRANGGVEGARPDSEPPTVDAHAARHDLELTHIAESAQRETEDESYRAPRTLSGEGCC